MESSNVSQIKPRLKLKFVNLRDLEFQQLCRGKLGNHPFKDQKTSYKVMRFLKELAARTEECSTQMAKLLKDGGYAPLDEKGEFVPKKGKDGEPIPGTYDILPEKREAWAAAQKEFFEVEVEMKWGPFTLEELEGLPLAPNEMEALECILILPTE